ncbi:MAG: folate-binding protein YgfZ [Gammaproteobacteria bacterium]|nr:folate-binding protein YgfZ [Gammaproteobacteria bacterium]
MHADWRRFLQHHGAHLISEGVADFGDPAAELQAAHDGTILADLSMEGIIRVDGMDAGPFLQGQLSTDVLTLTPLTSQLSSWNNSKGRVVTLLRLWELGGAIHLALPRSLTVPVLKRLTMYVLRSKVTLTDTSDALVHFGIAGRAASATLTACGWTAPTAPNTVAVKDGVTLTRLHGELPRFVFMGEPGKMQSMWDALKAKGAHPVGADGWALLRILAREPVIYPETSEHFVAQMLGLEELGAIDFKKGCYIGQEVIARAHYRGGVKRHMLRVEAKTEASLKAGMALHTADDGQPSAEIVDARRDPAGTWQLLVVVRDEHRTMNLHVPGCADMVELEPMP